MHNLWIDGKCLKEFGIYVSGENTFNAPEWDYESQPVPGRNGNLIIPSNRMKNISVPYPAFIRQKFRENAQAARLYLLSAGAKYRRIEDDYHPDSYRLGVFAGPLDFDMKFLNRGGETNLVFDCKPQRFLKIGEFPVQVESGQKLLNQWMDALPLIQISGTGDGQLMVGNSQVDITDMTGSIVLDCDVQNAYSGTINLNNNITVTGGWPVLETGQTAISFFGGITAVEITPRWWTL